MTPTQIKIAVYGGALLLAWWLADRARPRVKKELEVEVNILNPNFGLTDAEIAAQQRANPAIDPKMRELIDRSNALIAADDVGGDDQ
jgi:hypothetical protein